MSIPTQPPPSAEADRISLAADSDEHVPYVAASKALAELTPGAVLLGIVLGLVFALSSVYLALKVGLTVSASIPISVLSITIFRYISKISGQKPATILQNNMVQTTGSAGESVAAGVVFTLPALLLLGYNLPWTKVAAVAVVGGLLGVFLMIPLRNALIVKERRTLKYPEGTAAAEVLIVGEERGVQARTVFLGFGLAALYKLLVSGLHLWQEVPRYVFQRIAPTGKIELFGEIRAEISPELTGVGYIIGPRIAGFLFAGGCLSYFVLIPAIKLFGGGLTTIIPPGTGLIADMDATAVRANYVYYIGAGAVTAAGLISLLRSAPTILGAITGGFKRNAENRNGGDARPRTDRDMPMSIVFAGVALCVIAMIGLPQISINILAAALAVGFAFLFVTVSSRITGQIGASSNPISGMTVATVLLTALIFLAIGWTGPEHRVLALTIGGVVCVAAAVAGATSQDLKTGYIVGATPKRQQIGLLFGVTTSALLIGGMIQLLNRAHTTIVEKSYPGVVVSIIDAGAADTVNGVAYQVGHLVEEQGGAPAGKYLVDASHSIHYLIDPGIAGRYPTDVSGRTVEKLDSPKAQIMALVVDGILTQRLPWGLILIGGFLAIAIEILGIPSLPVAVGVYLPISTSATMFMGGVVRWLVEQRLPAEERVGAKADSGPGVLFSSGLIAGGAIMGVGLSVLAIWKVAGNRTAADVIDLSHHVGIVGASAAAAIILYILFLAVPLYRVGRGGSGESH
ncbi:MAG TPA: oligopeptide transporter, OPT family [Gemmatimonadaceae bacterium]|nr:oligopeptide transporter, OPT family [Gemmatimonadaceae bacterium]